MSFKIYKAGSSGAATGEVKVSSDDTTLGYLEGKLTNGYGVTFNIANPGGNESLDISINNGDLDGYFALLDSSNQPFTYSGFNSLSTALRNAYDSSGNSTLDWDLGVLLAFNDISIDWTNRLAYNYNGDEMIDWENGYLKDIAGIISIEWTNRTLRDPSGGITYNFGTGVLYGTDGFTSLDQNNRTLGDSSGNTSINFQNRALINSASATTFDYENLKFPTLTTDGLVVTTLGDGTLAIRPNLGGFGCTTNVSSGFIQTGIALRFRAPYDFQASEWFLSSLTGGDVQLDLLRDAAGWPVFTSASICNTAYPELISGSNAASGSATTWDPIDKDDYIVILISTVSALEDFTLQVIGDRL